MQRLIDKSYFWGELEITGLFKPETEDELNKFISKYQKKYLKDMFNGEFDNEIPAGVLTYLVDEETLTSPIANYVYLYWQQSKTPAQTNAGTKVLNTQNTTPITPDFKYVRIYNEMVKTNLDIHVYLSTLEDYDYTPIYEYLLGYKNDNGFYPSVLEYKSIFG